MPILTAATVRSVSPATLAVVGESAFADERALAGAAAERRAAHLATRYRGRS